MSAGATVAGTTLSCPRCGTRATAPDPRGCPVCRAEGVPVNLECERPDPAAVRAALRGDGARGGSRGLWRYAAALPVPVEHAVTLGEGDTPLVDLPRLAERLGVARVLAKNESANPTWSHKDRLSALAISAARMHGARAVAASSTGNHGASVAAYAARAGLPCVIFTLASVPETMKVLMQSYGAQVVALGSLEERYELMMQGVDRFGWYAATNSVSPPVGSDPYGADGYKAIAYELFEQLDGELPEWIVVPVAYGDCLRGLVRGLEDLEAAGLVSSRPRVVAAEVFPAIERALETGGDVMPAVETRPTAAFSIGTPYTTYQAAQAVRSCDGLAVSAGEDELLRMQLTLGGEGLFAEGAACVPFAVAQKMAAAGWFEPGDRVVCLLTSSGLKDPGANRENLGPVPRIEPTMEALCRVLDPAFTEEER